MPKVVIIGAGSVEFTRNIVADLCSYAELHGTVTFALHDIDQERLTYSHRAAQSIIRRTGAGYGVEAHADRRAALDGADYAINEIQVGGYEATVRDFEIPKKYGLRQTIADTLGIGGIMRGIRTIPVMVGIGNDMHELCPDALLLNYTNPMAMVPWGVYAGTPFQNVVGTCHSVRDTHHFLARTVGVPRGRRRVPHGRLQPPSVRARVPEPANRREPLPTPARDRRCRPRRARAASAGRDLQAVRLLRDRVERALKRVRALVHAGTTT